MLIFPNCKINLGLNVLEKRQDGFHNLHTVFYPIGWADSLEVIENKVDNQVFDFSQSGMVIDGPKENNIIYKAWQLISSQKKLPNLKIHLHKSIPMGAGLGGGSSDAANFINLLNSKFSLNFSAKEKTEIASQLGSDCAFFIENKAVFASGKGNDFSDIKLDLSNFYILLVYPNIHSNTKQAYENLIYQKNSIHLKEIIENYSIKDWKNLLVNDFEHSVFKKYPEINKIKSDLYTSGALYASMSGSGSTVFGIFDKKPEMDFPKNHLTYLQKPQPLIL